MMSVDNLRGIDRVAGRRENQGSPTPLTYFFIRHVFKTFKVKGLKRMTFMIPTIQPSNKSNKKRR